MAVLEWDNTEEKTVQGGVDRGVLYVHGQSGVAWNGLIALKRKGGDKTTAVYYDGRKINDLIEYGDYEAELTAFSFPDEFLVCFGVVDEQVGVQAHGQPRPRFNLTYRTKIYDSLGNEIGYKIHLVWNLLAVEKDEDSSTTSESLSPMEFSWDVFGIPPDAEGFRPTCHLTIDSTKVDPYILEDVENWLYGNENDDATMPTQKGFLAFFKKWNRFIVYHNDDGTWTATSVEDGVISVSGAGEDEEFEIVHEEAVYIDIPNGVYTLESSDKNEEDIY